MFKEIIRQYEESKIDKRTYGENMFQIYQNLIEYTELISRSMVEKIEINKNMVIIEIKKNNYTIKMVLHPIDSAAIPATILSFGDYESQELDMIFKLLKMIDEKCIIFDIGANLGWYTLNMLKDNSHRKVYAFEPIKDTYKKLLKNIKINSLTNVNLYNFGLYEKNKEVDFFYDVTASGASSIADLRELDSTRKVKCSLIKMDDFIKTNNIKRLDFIKCDVEGSELFVYKGGINSIEKFKPIIFSEMLRKWSAKFDYHPNDIIKLFHTINYKCFVINHNKLQEIKCVNEDTVETNYFFLHNDKHKNIIKTMATSNI